MVGQKKTNTPSVGPIAQQLTHIQSNGHQAPISSQQSVVNQSPKRADMSKVRDWLNVLGVFLIPLMIGVYTIAYNTQQSNIAKDSHQADLALQTDQQRETALASYIQNIKELISTEGLQTSKPNDEVRVIARAQTLITLRQLDGIRKGIVMQFLSEASLIIRVDIKKDVIIDLTSADLSRANLSFVNLRGAELSAANLSRADLSHAELANAHLEEAFLPNANLHGAFLGGADLSRANLRGADLSDAVLTDATITKEQLDKTYSLKQTTLPDGSIHS